MTAARREAPGGAVLLTKIGVYRPSTPLYASKIAVCTIAPSRWLEEFGVFVATSVSTKI
jgi:hypothetical protein